MRTLRSAVLIVSVVVLFLSSVTPLAALTDPGCGKCELGTCVGGRCKESSALSSPSRRGSSEVASQPGHAAAGLTFLGNACSRGTELLTDLEAFFARLQADAK